MSSYFAHFSIHYMRSGFHSNQTNNIMIEKSILMFETRLESQALNEWSKFLRTNHFWVNPTNIHWITYLVHLWAQSEPWPDCSKMCGRGLRSPIGNRLPEMVFTPTARVRLSGGRFGTWPDPRTGLFEANQKEILQLVCESVNRCGPTLWLNLCSQYSCIT